MKPGTEKISGVDDTWIQAEISRICFSEIRLSQARVHATRYGDLGIGFSREFVLEREGNPVFYVQNGAKGHVIQNLDRLRGFVENSRQKKKELEVILGYLKNMSEKNDSDLKYYDEMEWRIVHLENRMKERRVAVEDESQNIYRLTLKPNDIKIIVFPDNETQRKALSDDFIQKYFKSYLPMMVTLDECDNF